MLLWSFGPKGTQIGPKGFPDVFLFLSIIKKLSDFFSEAAVAWRLENLKLTQMIFLENAILGILGNNGPKRNF